MKTTDEQRQYWKDKKQLSLMKKKKEKEIHRARKRKKDRDYYYRKKAERIANKQHKETQQKKEVDNFAEKLAPVSIPSTTIGTPMRATSATPIQHQSLFTSPTLSDTFYSYMLDYFKDANKTIKEMQATSVKQVEANNRYVKLFCEQGFGLRSNEITAGDHVELPPSHICFTNSTDSSSSCDATMISGVSSATTSNRHPRDDATMMTAPHSDAGQHDQHRIS